ncbi:MAG: FAD-dependent thymidylate synthase [Terriglobales bacterium]
MKYGVAGLRKGAAEVVLCPEMPDRNPDSQAAVPAPAPQDTEVYAVFGAEPEVQAYAMAKYSRSALSMKESLAELNEQRAEKFLNTFYFQYGHRSIADLAHIAMAIEKLSILAAIILVDEQRWDGQERSTRYQNFKKSGYYVPDFAGDAATEGIYRDAVRMLIGEYEVLSEGMWRYLADRTPKPAEMKDDQYERTLRARAFDITRYLLPLAANTSLGQIVNARTLENQVSRLLSHTHPEVRRLGVLLKQAAREPAFNVNHAAFQRILEEIPDREFAKNVREILLKPVRVSPTLVKYADASAYEMESRRELTHAAGELMRPVAMEQSPAVTLLEDEPFEIELAATLLYEHSHHSYRQIRQQVEGLSEQRRNEIIDLGLRHRGRHDELRRAFSAGQRFRFDILMDIGAFRDLHRHRRCIQIGQDFTPLHGYDVPEEVRAAGAKERYDDVMQRAIAAYKKVSEASPETHAADYLLPMAFRKRTLFKMDFAEAVYISELRTGTGGHISYRRIAYQMYQAVVRRYPALAQYFRVTDPEEPVDLLKR